jgi:hypothetical protein
MVLAPASAMLKQIPVLMLIAENDLKKSKKPSRADALQLYQFLR